MIITIVKRPQEHPAMTHSRMSIALFAGLMSLSLAGAPAAFAQTTKDNMGKTDSMSKDTMSKDSMSKDDEEGHNVEGQHVQGLDEERRRHVQGQYEEVRLETVGLIYQRARPHRVIDVRDYLESGHPNKGRRLSFGTCDTLCPYAKLDR